VGVGAATIKMDGQKDKEFSIVGSFLGRFCHRRNKCRPNAQVKGGKNLTPNFSSQKNYPLTQKPCIFGP
jgi:hypothetical protein